MSAARSGSGGGGTADDGPTASGPQGRGQGQGEVQGASRLLRPPPPLLNLACDRMPQGGGPRLQGGSGSGSVGSGGRPVGDRMDAATAPCAFNGRWVDGWVGGWVVGCVGGWVGGRVCGCVSLYEPL